MVKTVVTGGAGFIGSHLADFLAQSGSSVTVIDDFSAGRKTNVPKKARLVDSDFADEKTLERELEGAQRVFHLAAIASVPLSIKEPELTRRVNVDGTRLLIEKSVDAGVESFVFTSSASVYGNVSGAGIQKESDLLHPESPYAESKAEGEALVRAAAARKGLRACSLRLFNVYGPRQMPGGAYSAAIPAFLDAALKGKDLVVYGGSQTRDFVFVKDVARAFSLASERCTKEGKVYNIASGKSISVIELAEKIRAVAGSGSKIRIEAERRGEVRKSEASVSLAERDLGFKARYEMDEGLAETLAYFKKL